MTQAVGVGKDMNTLYDSLLDILRREIEVYREILEIIQEERRILLRPSLGGLDESNARKETWILKARLLEEVRMNLVERLAAELGVPVDEANLSALASAASEGRAEMLRECQSVLKALFQGLRDLNQRNRALIDTSLQFLRDTAGFLNEILSPKTGYSGTGELKTVNRNGKILCVEG